MFEMEKTEEAIESPQVVALFAVSADEDDPRACNWWYQWP